MFALDDGRLEAKLGGADGRHIAAGAGADDENVEIVVGHGLYSLFLIVPGLDPEHRL